MSVTTSPTGGPLNFADPNILSQGAAGQPANSLNPNQPTNPVYAPSSFSTQYQLQQIEAQGGTITVGAQMAQILGIPPAAYPMHALLQDFNNLSQSQLIQIQTLLWDGGFYTDSTGGPQSTAPTFGAHDNQTFIAFANSLLQSSQSGRSMDDTIMGNVSQGVGQAQRSMAMGPGEVGGANTYRIDLTNPQDIAYTARTVFQAGLGRAPTQKELDAVISTVQSGQRAAGTAYANVQEGAQQQAFAAREAGRQAARAPQVALGPIPNGPFADIGQWAVAFLRYLNDPVTDSNIATIIGWSKAAGQGLGGNNPLGTTLAEAGSTATGQGPGQSPQKYQQAADGMKAAAQTLGNFPTIMAALKGGNAQAVLGQKAVQDEFNQFSAGAYRDITKQAGAASKAATAANQKWGDRGVTQPGQDAGTAAAVARAQGGGRQMGAPQLPEGDQGAGGAGKGVVPADVMAAYGGNPPPNVVATFQAAQQNPAVAAYLQSQAQAASGAGVVPADVAAAYGGQVPQNVQATFRAAQQNPAVAAYLQQRAQQAQGMGSTIPGTAGMGQQPQAPGTTYLPATIFSDVSGPSPEGAAFQAASTGANRIPYLGYQYLNAFQAIMDMVHSGGLITGSGG